MPRIRIPTPTFQWAMCREDGRLYGFREFHAGVGFPEQFHHLISRCPSFSQKFPVLLWILTLGSLAWDPVNKEVISSGGTADTDGGSPGTWAFNPVERKWRRFVVGQRDLKELRVRAGALSRRS